MFIYFSFVFTSPRIKKCITSASCIKFVNDSTSYVTSSYAVYCSDYCFEETA